MLPALGSVELAGWCRHGKSNKTLLCSTKIIWSKRPTKFSCVVKKWPRIFCTLTSKLAKRLKGIAVINQVIYLLSSNSIKYIVLTSQIIPLWNHLTFAQSTIKYLFTFFVSIRTCIYQIGCMVNARYNFSNQPPWRGLMLQCLSLIQGYPGSPLHTYLMQWLVPSPIVVVEHSGIFQTHIY